MDGFELGIGVGDGVGAAVGASVKTSSAPSLEQVPPLRSGVPTGQSGTDLRRSCMRPKQFSRVSATGSTSNVPSPMSVTLSSTLRRRNAVVAFSLMYWLISTWMAPHGVSGTTPQIWSCTPLGTQSSTPPSSGIETSLAFTSYANVGAEVFSAAASRAESTVVVAEPRTVTP